MRADPSHPRPAAGHAAGRAPANPPPGWANRPGHGWGLVLGGWALLGVVLVGPILAQSLAEGRGVPWSKVVSELLGWYLWAAFFPLIAWICHRFPLTVGREERRAAALPALAGRGLVHVVCGTAVAVAYVVLSLVKSEAVVAAFGGRFSLAASLEYAPTYLRSGLELYLLVYFAIVAGIHALTFYEELRDRDRRTSRLASQLAVAELQLLRMQLHPHFLFNTLNAISALMRRDLDAADRAISLLSELLRFSLEEDDRHLVPLRRELEVLDRYLQIERLRFADRLHVEIDVPRDCLGAQVPRLILQPLVENSVRHAVAVRSSQGEIVVRARQKGDRLLLQVEDDGPGPESSRDADARDRPGVGLANTRARLEQIYGRDHRFSLGDLDPGTLAEIEIPFEEEPRDPSGVMAAPVFG